MQFKSELAAMTMELRFPLVGLCLLIGFHLQSQTPAPSDTDQCVALSFFGNAADPDSVIKHCSAAVKNEKSSNHDFATVFLTRGNAYQMRDAALNHKRIAPR